MLAFAKGPTTLTLGILRCSTYNTSWHMNSQTSSPKIINSMSNMYLVRLVLLGCRVTQRWECPHAVSKDHWAPAHLVVLGRAFTRRRPLPVVSGSTTVDLDYPSRNWTPNPPLG